MFGYGAFVRNAYAQTDHCTDSNLVSKTEAIARRLVGIFVARIYISGGGGDGARGHDGDCGSDGSDFTNDEDYDDVNDSSGGVVYGDNDVHVQAMKLKNEEVKMVMKKRDKLYRRIGGPTDGEAWRVEWTIVRDKSTADVCVMQVMFAMVYFTNLS